MIEPSPLRRLSALGRFSFHDKRAMAVLQDCCTDPVIYNQVIDEMATLNTAAVNHFGGEVRWWFHPLGEVISRGYLYLEPLTRKSEEDRHEVWGLEFRLHPHPEAGELSQHHLSSTINQVFVIRQGGGVQAEDQNPGELGVVAQPSGGSFEPYARHEDGPGRSWMVLDTRNGQKKEMTMEEFQELEMRRRYREEALGAPDPLPPPQYPVNTSVREEILNALEKQQGAAMDEKKNGQDAENWMVAGRDKNENYYYINQLIALGLHIPRQYEMTWHTASVNNFIFNQIGTMIQLVEEEVRKKMQVTEEALKWRVIYDQPVAPSPLTDLVRLECHSGKNGADFDFAFQMTVALDHFALPGGNKYIGLPIQHQYNQMPNSPFRLIGWGIENGAAAQANAGGVGIHRPAPDDILNMRPTTAYLNDQLEGFYYPEGKSNPPSAANWGDRPQQKVSLFDRPQPTSSMRNGIEHVTQEEYLKRLHAMRLVLHNEAMPILNVISLRGSEYSRDDMKMRANRFIDKACAGPMISAPLSKDLDRMVRQAQVEYENEGSLGKVQLWFGYFSEYQSYNFFIAGPSYDGTGNWGGMEDYDLAFMKTMRRISVNIGLEQGQYKIQGFAVHRNTPIPENVRVMHVATGPIEGVCGYDGLMREQPFRAFGESSDGTLSNMMIPLEPGAFDPEKEKYKWPKDYSQPAARERYISHFLPDVVKPSELNDHALKRRIQFEGIEDTVKAAPLYQYPSTPLKSVFDAEQFNDFKPLLMIACHSRTDTVFKQALSKVAIESVVESISHAMAVVEQAATQYYGHFIGKSELPWTFHLDYIAGSLHGVFTCCAPTQELVNGTDEVKTRIRPVYALSWLVKQHNKLDIGVPFEYNLRLPHQRFPLIATSFPDRFTNLFKEQIALEWQENRPAMTVMDLYQERPLFLLNYSPAQYIGMWKSLSDLTEVGEIRAEDPRTEALIKACLDDPSTSAFDIIASMKAIEHEVQREWGVGQDTRWTFEVLTFHPLDMRARFSACAAIPEVSEQYWPAYTFDVRLKYSRQNDKLGQVAMTGEVVEQRNLAFTGDARRALLIQEAGSEFFDDGDHQLKYFQRYEQKLLYGRWALNGRQLMNLYRLADARGVPVIHGEIQGVIGGTANSEYAQSITEGNQAVKEHIRKLMEKDYPLGTIIGGDNAIENLDALLDMGRAQAEDEGLNGDEPIYIQFHTWDEIAPHINDLREDAEAYRRIYDGLRNEDMEALHALQEFIQSIEEPGTYLFEYRAVDGVDEDGEWGRSVGLQLHHIKNARMVMELTLTVRKLEETGDDAGAAE